MRVIGRVAAAGGDAVDRADEVVAIPRVERDLVVPGDQHVASAGARGHGHARRRDGPTHVRGVDDEGDALAAGRRRGGRRREDADRRERERPEREQAPY